MASAKRKRGRHPFVPNMRAPYDAGGALMTASWSRPATFLLVSRPKHSYKPRCGKMGQSLESQSQFDALGSGACAHVRP
jgi:hypothetical protein